jgi:DNA modification methylase
VILQGDCLEVLRTLDAGIAQTCVTSPPYWGLRDYGTATWQGGDAGCDHKAPPAGGWQCKVANGETDPFARGGNINQQYKDTCPKCGAIRIDQQLGLERTPEEYTAKMVAIFREVRRVLRDDGTLWLNLGDSYTSGGRGSYPDDIQGSKQATSRAWNDETNAVKVPRNPEVPRGMKPKDLCGIPWITR